MNIVSWILLACWAVFVTVWIVSAFFAKRDKTHSHSMRSWLIRIIVIALAITLVEHFSLIGARVHSGFYSGFFNVRTGSVPLDAAAAALCIFGISLALWARFYLGRNWSPAPALKVEHELVVSGPYRLIRHPIYTGILLAMLGSALIILPWIAVFVVFGGIFLWRVRLEEELMMGQFPDQYPVYKKRTWALIPYVW